MEYLLEDITVVDAATFLAGPGAATILADYGANVIKIEPPSGDGYRSLVGRYPVPYHWLLTSRNKKSLAVDLNKDAGRALVHKILEKADVLTSNFLATQLKKYELEYETVKTINPRIIFAHISGYGLKGEDAERRAFDTTAWWARSGLMEFIRDPEQTPLAPAPGMGDHATSTALFGAIMTGLYRREKTGVGCFVSTSLVANGVWSNGMALQGAIAGNDIGEYRQKTGWINPLSACYQCADGNYIVLAIINTEREFPKLCEAIGRPDILEDERFLTIRLAMRNREDLQTELNKEFIKHSSISISEALEEAGITFGPVQTMAQVLEDPQLKENDIIVETGEAEGDYVKTINSPLSILEEVKKRPSRAPDIGADTISILESLDFDQSYIKALLKAEVIFSGATED